MNDGDFNSNFTWFEWGFVSPDQLPAEEPATEDTRGHTMYANPRDGWVEDPRWST